ncbi:hypothetical protein FisN_7Lh375 [Fistulifera solaris]|uniref:Uncharacterized protein n=1 Tax=Fistulifera solaris TaxID=1519565 RepID=A0A1Z5JBE5_FISSO|nr:hypothetical protein FisN_7Lh375 [Fistulifera solaris]|eukprot:GAX11276.1 hypothetical protein FisN_7Lh375 [Fistulifera solaris]
MVAPNANKKETKVSYETCRKLSENTNNIDDLPASCRAYSAIVELMEQKKLKSRPTDPFAGMRAGAAVEAKRAKAEGRESHHQLQRRLSRAGERKFTK